MARPFASWLAFSTLFSVPLAAQQGALAGIVYDSLAGAPLAGARVSVSGTALSALTDASGAFRIAGVTAGGSTASPSPIPAWSRSAGCRTRCRRAWPPAPTRAWS